MIKYHKCRLDNKGSEGMTDTFTQGLVDQGEKNGI